MEYIYIYIIHGYIHGYLSTSLSLSLSIYIYIYIPSRRRSRRLQSESLESENRCGPRPQRGLFRVQGSRVWAHVLQIDIRDSETCPDHLSRSCLEVHLGHAGEECSRKVPRTSSAMPGQCHRMSGRHRSDSWPRCPWYSFPLWCDVQCCCMLYSIVRDKGARLLVRTYICMQQCMYAPAHTHTHTHDTLTASGHTDTMDGGQRLPCIAQFTMCTLCNNLKPYEVRCFAAQTNNMVVPFPDTLCRSSDGRLLALLSRY